MSDEKVDRAGLLDQMKTSINKLDRFFVPYYPVELFKYRPGIEDAWTISEHLVHLYDADVCAYIFGRKAVVSPGTPLWVAGGKNWLEQLCYADQRIDTEFLQAFKGIRSQFYNFLFQLEDRHWDEVFLSHEKRGRVNIEFLLRVIALHIDGHLEFIERNERLWEEKNKG